MKSIYASKLYLASTRKDAISSAMNNPNNQGLMIQLARYLDEEYKTPENLGVHPEEEKAEADEKKADAPNMSTDTSFAREPGHGGGSGRISGLPEGMDLVDFPESEDDLPSDEGEGSNDSEFEGPDVSEEPQEPTESATELEPIEACETPSVDTVKSSLNAVQDTAGVQRVSLKDCELWVYYDDAINLNNIMTGVIEYLGKAGYSNLEFNRLARSDNAMVFEVLQDSTPVEVHYEQE